MTFTLLAVLVTVAALLVVVAVYLEAVMNSIGNGLGMRKAGDRGGAGRSENPHSHAVLTQVHNTL